MYWGSFESDPNMVYIVDDRVYDMYWGSFERDPNMVYTVVDRV